MGLLIALKLMLFIVLFSLVMIALMRMIRPKPLKPAENLSALDELVKMEPAKESIKHVKAIPCKCGCRNLVATPIKLFGYSFHCRECSRYSLGFDLKHAISDWNNNITQPGPCPLI